MKSETTKIQTKATTTAAVGPSQHLRDLIEEAVNHMNNLKDLRDKIYEQGKKEGFSEVEIIGLVRAELRGRLNKDQLYYLLHREKKLQQVKNYQEKMLDNNRKFPTVIPDTADVEPSPEMNIVDTKEVETYKFPVPLKLEAFVDLRKLVGALNTEIRECKLNNIPFSKKGVLIIEKIEDKNIYVLKDLEYVTGEDDVVDW